ncbi:MAG: PepSY domain-containing protein [Proteobacteria bacterium]|nr:PepSY domain-containing protein [Pseudomonadota bacterium]
MNNLEPGRLPGGDRLRAICRFFALYFVVAGLSVACPVHADGHGSQWEDDDHSYDRARRAVSRGEVLPIEKILERVRTQVPGQILEIEFEQEHGRWVYEFKIIDDKGRLLEAYFDAQSGKLLSAEED